MADFSATDAAFTGIRFVRERPRAVAIWAGIQIVISLVFGTLVLVAIGPYLMQLQALNHPGQTPELGQVMALIGQLLPMYGLFLIISLAIHSVLYATMARAVLEPPNEGFAYIRFGMDEARQCLLVLLLMAIIIAANIAATVAVVAAVVLAGLAFHGLGPLVGVLAALMICAAMIYCFVRLSLASPLTFDSRRVDLFGSWRLTRGHFWKMLGTYLLVLGVGLIILILTLIITVAVAVVLGGIGAAASLFRPDMGSVGALFIPARLGVSLVWALVTPLIWALFFMPASAIYRQLRQS